jgi:hypothetical protein
MRQHGLRSGVVIGARPLLVDHQRPPRVACTATAAARVRQRLQQREARLTQPVRGRR